MSQKPIHEGQAREVAHTVRRLEVLREQIAERERQLLALVLPGDTLEFVYDGRLYHAWRERGAATVSYRPTVPVALPILEVPIERDDP